MTGEEFARMLQEKADEVHDFMENIYPDLAGDIAVNHFRENFDKEGFVDNGLHPWQNVERRDPQSPWYGFESVNKRGFSPTRATDPILKDTNRLFDAIEYEVRGAGEVAIVNDEPYAAVHNDGGMAYIFGKTPFEMPKRQFIGHSKELDEKIEDLLTDELDHILE